MVTFARHGHCQQQLCSCVCDLRSVSSQTVKRLHVSGNWRRCCNIEPNHQQHQQLYLGRCCSSSIRSRCSLAVCRAAPANRPETVAVIEYLLLLQAQPGSDPDDMEVLLDSLWSLQYMVPFIMYASAGNITACTLCNKQDVQQQQQQQYTQQEAEAAAGADPGAQQQQLVPGMFTHAVHYRLSSRSALETLLLHPMMAAMQEQISSRCAASAQLVFEGTVTKRLEALFRRGDEYASGVEHILLLQPGLSGGAGADEFLERLAALAESSVAGGIQASYGAVISCAHAAATHVLMTRFAAAQQVQQLLATPACAAVMARDARVPVVAASSLCICIQPTEESTKVDGGGGLQQ